ncbi:hypothetical protein ABZ936_28990, partial [Streptomyces sp. NPDC046685]
GNNSPLTESDPTGEALPECHSGMYKCTNGSNPYDYGHNYEKEVAIAGGTLGRAYVNRKNSYQRACRHDPDCGKYRSRGYKNTLSPVVKKAPPVKKAERPKTGIVHASNGGMCEWYNKKSCEKPQKKDFFGTPPAEHTFGDVADWGVRRLKGVTLWGGRFGTIAAGVGVVGGCVIGGGMSGGIGCAPGAAVGGGWGFATGFTIGGTYGVFRGSDTWW